MTDIPRVQIEALIEKLREQAIKSYRAAMRHPARSHVRKVMNTDGDVRDDVASQLAALLSGSPQDKNVESPGPQQAQPGFRGHATAPIVGRTHKRPDRGSSSTTDCRGVGVVPRKTRSAVGGTRCRC